MTPAALDVGVVRSTWMLALGQALGWASLYYIYGSLLVKALRRHSAENTQTKKTKARLFADAAMHLSTGLPTRSKAIAVGTVSMIRFLMLLIVIKFQVDIARK